MSGVKGKSGGAREGSGRKSKPTVMSSIDDPLTFLRSVWKGEIEVSSDQVRAAVAALPYVCQRIGDMGKKDIAKAEADRVSTGRFSATSPPKLVINNVK